MTPCKEQEEPLSYKTVVFAITCSLVHYVRLTIIKEIYQQAISFDIHVTVSVFWILSVKTALVIHVTISSLPQHAQLNFQTSL